MGRHTFDWVFRGIMLPLCLLAGVFGGQTLVMCHGSDGHQGIELTHAGGACGETRPCHGEREDQTTCLAAHEHSCDDRPLVSEVSVDRNRSQRLPMLALLALLPASNISCDATGGTTATTLRTTQLPPQLPALRTITLLI